MAKVFDPDTGARVVIVSDDHCPPHVHAAHRAERWGVRIGFSFAPPNFQVNVDLFQTDRESKTSGRKPNTENYDGQEVVCWKSEL